MQPTVDREKPKADDVVPIDDIKVSVNDMGKRPDGFWKINRYSCP